MASKSGTLDGDKGADAEELLDTVESLLDRVKALYEQYFLGIQKQAPSYLHSDLDRKLRELSQLAIRNTALRYRLATVQQKFGSYNTYWRRTLRQIENGTYTRNLSRISRQAARTGEAIPEEILAAMPKRMREQVVRDREAAMALQKRRDGAGARDAALVSTADSTLDLAPLEDFDLDIEEAALEDVATIHSKAPVVHTLTPGTEDDDVDVDALFAAITEKEEPRRAPAGPRTTARGVMPAVEPPLPEVARTTLPGAAVPSGLAAEPARPVPARPAEPARPAPMRAATEPGATAPTRGPAPARAAPPSAQRRALDPSEGSAAAAVPAPASPPPPASEPVHEEDAPTFRASQASAPLPPPSAAAPPPRPSSPARAASPPARAASVAPRPAPPPSPPPPPPEAASPAGAAAEAPAEGRSTKLPAPAPPPRPRVVPPSSVPPIGGLRPPPKSEPLPPPPPPRAKPATPAIPAIPRPPTARPAGPGPAAPPSPPPATSPAQPAPAARPLPRGVTEAEVTRLYDEYVRAKARVGESNDDRTYDRLLRTIEQQAPKIMEEHRAKGVEFQVVVKDNQVILRAKPKP